MSFKLVDTDMMNWLDSKLYKYAGWRKWRGLPEPISPQMAEISRKALNIVLVKANFGDALNRELEWLKIDGDTITIRKPKRYVSGR